MKNDDEKHGCAKHGIEKSGPCCGQNRPMQRFIETCLLLLLARQTSHGYHLGEQLKNFGIEDINASTLYRIMRKMEERELVSSSWEKGDQGPQKRVYSISPLGIETLSEWIEVFTRRRANIDLLLCEYKQYTSAAEE